MFQYLQPLSVGANHAVKPTRYHLVIGTILRLEKVLIDLAVPDGWGYSHSARLVDF